MLEVRKLHECEKPSMQVGTKTVWEKRGWWGGRVKRERPVFSNEEARFTCDICGSKWSWHGPSTIWKGFWICDYRSEEWVEVSE